MQEITDYALCSGCHACYSVCPQRCISMHPNADGFLYPEIDAARCVDCGLCKQVCPIEREYAGRKAVGAYACINREEATRLKSSSGGVFTVLASEVLRQGGVVIGAAFNEKQTVEHIAVEALEDLEKLQGSKYLQSKIGNILQETKDFLENGRLVYFSGTPCQVGGLKTYLRKDYDNLICQDMICYGVPSPKVWEKYLDFVCEKHNKTRAEIQSVRFRNKDNGWLQYCLKIYFRDGSYIRNSVHDDLYMKAFLHNCCLRPSCYACHSKSVDRESDITLADFWGVDKILPEMYDDKGTSLVVVSSQKGKDLFDRVQGEMRCAAVDLQAAVSKNTAAFQSVAKPKAYEKFMQSVDTLPFDKAVKAVVRESAPLRLKKMVRRLLKCFKTKRF